MNNSLKKKFTFGLLCVSIIPVLILFALHLKSSYEFYNEQTKTIASGEIDKAVYQADTVFKEIDDLVTSLIFSQYESEYFIRSMSVQEEENSSLSAIDRLKNYRKFTYICSNLIRNNKYVGESICLTEAGTLTLIQSQRIFTWKIIIKTASGIEKSRWKISIRP